MTPVQSNEGFNICAKKHITSMLPRVNTSVVIHAALICWGDSPSEVKLLAIWQALNHNASKFFCANIILAFIYLLN